MTERASGTVLADAVKYTVMTNMAPIFLKNSLAIGVHMCKQCRVFEQLCCNVVIIPGTCGANPRPCQRGNGTGADDDSRMQVDSFKKV